MAATPDPHRLPCITTQSLPWFTTQSLPCIMHASCMTSQSFPCNALHRHPILSMQRPHSLPAPPPNPYHASSIITQSFPCNTDHFPILSMHLPPPHSLPAPPPTLSMHHLLLLSMHRPPNFLPAPPPNPYHAPPPTPFRAPPGPSGEDPMTWASHEQMSRWWQSRCCNITSLFSTGVQRVFLHLLLNPVAVNFTFTKTEAPASPDDSAIAVALEYSIARIGACCPWAGVGLGACFLPLGVHTAPRRRTCEPSPATAAQVPCGCLMCVRLPPPPTHPLLRTPQPPPWRMCPSG
jgi:hypothetical protein